ncbi:amidohydrolase family protein [Schaalia sp. lx-100]|uniref:amidohydrolase family protein n=1 Tax=Schaalia sp. lx-100 TaxID=2899081 RepID=UPI001E444BFD|nr:amidohydrolase family protein [Schaalia sp. lx-100]
MNTSSVSERSQVPANVHLWSADLVVPITAPSVLGGAVAVLNGRIEHIGSRDWVITTLRERGMTYTETHVPGVLLPGFVNAHTHLQYTNMAEVGLRQYDGFPSWMAAFDAIYDAGPLDWETSAAQGAEYMLRYGATCVADVVTDPEAASALHDAGLHGVAYWEVMGYSNEEWAQRGVSSVHSALEKMPTPPAIGISPHAPYSLEVAPLLEIPDLARRRGLRLHIHLGEAQMEARWDDVEGGAALADLWRNEKSASFTSIRQAGVGFSATEFVDQLGVLGPDCHIAHGVYMTADDRRRLRARSTAVALCPRSNAVIGLDEPPVAAYLSEGNLIAVGTDSLSSSPSLDILEDVALLYDIARRQGYGSSDLSRRLLQAATLGGATALGLATGQHRVGQLQAGALADMVVVDVPVTDVMSTIECVVREGAGRQVATIIEGQLRYAATNFPHDDVAGQSADSSVFPTRTVKG